VPEGSVFGFLGPNGAGKTTTLRILAGLARPTSGAAHVLGHDVTGAGGDGRALVGFLPDVPAFYGWMTAPQYLRFAGSLFGLRGTAALALAKPLSRGALVLAKWLSQLLVIAVAAVIATAACIALTAVLLGVGPAPETVAAVALWFVYAIVILSAMVLLSAVLPAPAAAAVWRFSRREI
jgi:ABC-type cobalamin/Fe3+-siderophores transport system ATPase subunit